MNYFKNKNNEIFAYDNEQVKQGYGKDLIPITEEEKDLILAPTAEELEEVRVSEIKSKAQSLILSKYSLEKQSSAQLGLYGEEYLAEMKDYIANIIRISNQAEVDGTNLEDIQWQ